MRPRKAAVVLRDPARDEEVEPFSLDEAGDDAPAAFDPPFSFERVCMACGGGHEGCEHLERVSFLLPSPVIRARIERLRRAAAEHRAAARALRALATSEHARGRADLETSPALPSEPPPWVDAPPPATPAAPLTAPCPRCAERGERDETTTEAVVAPAPSARRARKKAPTSAGQGSFAFLASSEAPPGLDG
jgi:hypothetical protein